MWILLKEGDVVRETDEYWRDKTAMWMPAGAYPMVGTRVLGEPHDAFPMRRNVTGWEAVRYAIEREVPGNGKERGCCGSWPGQKPADSMKQTNLSDHGKEPTYACR
jgi:hypothetical protein